MTALIAFTRTGCQLGQRLARTLGGTLWTTGRLSAELGIPAYGDLQAWTGERFRDSEALIFISASGIAVRAIAPFVRDKFSDPAVVSVDELGRFAVPLLSGHVGGANALAQQVAKITGGQAAVSTATDVQGKCAVDVWAKEQNLVLTSRELAKAVSAALLDNEPVGISSEFPIAGTLPAGLTQGPAEIGICVSHTTEPKPFPQTLHLVPKAVTLGIGCRRGTSRDHLEDRLAAFLEAHALPEAAVIGLASIDLKKDEQGLLELAQAHDWPIQFYPAEELAREPGDFPPSHFVQKTTGVDNVCQRAAQRAGGTVFIPKTASDGVTFAAAMGTVTLTWTPSCPL